MEVANKQLPQSVFLKVNRWLARIGGTVIFLMMFYILFDVAGRYLFHHPIPGSIELSETVLPIVVFLGITFHEVNEGHVSITMITSRLPAGYRFACSIAVKTIEVFVFALLGWKGFEYLTYAWTHHSTTGEQFKISQALPLAAIFIGCLLFLAYSIGTFAKRPETSGKVISHELD